MNPLYEGAVRETLALIGLVGGDAFYDGGLGCDDAIPGEIDPSTGSHFLSIYDMITMSLVAQIVLTVACVRAIAACLR